MLCLISFAHHRVLCSVMNSNIFISPAVIGGAFSNIVDMMLSFEIRFCTLVCHFQFITCLPFNDILMTVCLCNYSDGGRSNSSSIFISGFVLGGLIVGTLGAVYAPQVSTHRLWLFYLVLCYFISMLFINQLLPIVEMCIF